MWDPKRWRVALRERQDEDDCRTLRLRSHTGRPLGSDSFLAELKTRLGRRVRALPGGRPRRVPEEPKRGDCP